MKKGLVLIVVLLAGFCFSGIAQAAVSDTVTVKVTILASLSVDLTESEILLGDVSIGSTTASATGVTVTNSGSGIAETYSLSLIDPGTWTASQTAAGAETYVLNAAFDADGATITWDATNHALSDTPVVSTATEFAGDQTGVSVPYNETRTLWFQFLAPTATSVTAEQEIAVTVTAQAS